MKNIRTLLKVAGGGILLSWLTSSCAGLGVDLDYDDGYYYPYWSPGYNLSLIHISEPTRR